MNTLDENSMAIIMRPLFFSRDGKNTFDQNLKQDLVYDQRNLKKIDFFINRFFKLNKKIKI